MKPIVFCFVVAVCLQLVIEGNAASLAKKQLNSQLLGNINKLYKRDGDESTDESSSDSSSDLSIEIDEELAEILKPIFIYFSAKEDLDNPEYRNALGITEEDLENAMKIFDDSSEEDEDEKRDLPWKKVAKRDTDESSSDSPEEDENEKRDLSWKKVAKRDSDELSSDSSSDSSMEIDDELARILKPIIKEFILYSSDKKDLANPEFRKKFGITDEDVQHAKDFYWEESSEEDEYDKRHTPWKEVAKRDSDESSDESFSDSIEINQDLEEILKPLIKELTNYLNNLSFDSSESSESSESE